MRFLDRSPFTHAVLEIFLLLLRNIEEQSMDNKDKSLPPLPWYSPSMKEGGSMCFLPSSYHFV